LFKEDLQIHQELAVAKAVIAEVEIQVELAPPKVLENQVILQIKQVLKKEALVNLIIGKDLKKGNMVIKEVKVEEGERVKKVKGASIGIRKRKEV